MENNGWVKIHRKLLFNPICQKPHYTWVWIYLLLICNHEDQDFIWNGEKITIKRGQVITGRINISKNTGVPETTVERILKYLEKSEQIGQQKTNKFRLITVKNYNLYQDQRTTNGQQTDNKRTQTRMNKNDKNYRDGQKFSFKDGTVGIMRFGEWVDIGTHAKLGWEYLKELK